MVRDTNRCKYVVQAIGVKRFGGGGGTGGHWGARWAKPFAGCELIAAPATKLCQIITFLTLEIDNIAKLRIEFKSILLEIPSICCIVVYVHGEHLRSCRDGQLT